MAIFTVFNEDIYILPISKPFPHHIIKCNCIFKPLHGKPKTFLQVIGGFGAHNNNNNDKKNVNAVVSGACTPCGKIFARQLKTNLQL